jgi:spermidine synthase
MRDEPTPDEITMIMAGMLPLILHPQPREIAVIGWGSGLTTHTLLGSAVPTSVDTIEIEAAMVEGAKLFGSRVERGYTDPRSHPRIDDARTFFSTGARRYDVIISEPSNPWVSGVASLFTQEFYGFLRRHLNDGGMVVQWLHTYEIDDSLFATMIGAILSEFPDTDLYLTNTSDMLIVARTGPAQPLPKMLPVLEGSALSIELRRVQLNVPDQIALRHVGSGNVLRNYVGMFGVRPHSDYFPVVSLNAPRTRFMGSTAQLIDATLGSGMPVLDILDCRVPVGRAAGLPLTGDSSISLWQHRALARTDWMAGGIAAEKALDYWPEVFDEGQALVANSRLLSRAPYLFPRWTEDVAVFAGHTIGFLPATDLSAAWIAPSWLPRETAAIPEVSDIMAAYSAAARRNSREMRQFARSVLERPASRQSPRLREQMLSIAMLGALGMGDHAAALALEQRYARGVPDTPSRRFIVGWARGTTPACLARRQ